MRGIHAALEGRLGQDVELRRSESGKGLGAPVRGRGRGEPCDLGFRLGLRGEGPSA